MARWLIYLKERFPLVTYVLLTGGLCLSAESLGGGGFQPVSFAIAFLGLILFFGELRLMDELKDYEKDLIAHPERPLPRGLLSRPEVKLGIQTVWLLMLGFAAVLMFFDREAAGFSYLITTFYLWLMYKEFYVGESLSKYPLVYAATHQIILLPLCTFAVAVARPDLWATSLNLGFGLTILGAFFAYEICRKLDPAAHPILKTYLFTYGMAKTAVLVAAALAVASFGAGLLGESRLLLPFEILLVLSTIVLFREPGRYKWVEGLAGVCLLVHMWGVFLSSVTGW